MGKDAAIAAVRRFRSLLEARGVAASRIILFGSYAKGTARDDSDIDLVVLSPHFAGRGLMERIDLMAPAIWETHAPIEAVPLTPEEWDSGDSAVVQFAADGEDV